MSLRARILLIVLAATLLPILALLWLLVQQRDESIERAREQIAARSTEIAADLEDKIAGTSQLLFGLARVPALESADKAACSGFLADVLREHPQYTGLLTIRPNGDVHCDSLRSGRVLNVSDRDYFQRALNSEKPVVEPVFGRITGIAVLQIAYAVRDAEGGLRYVLLASFNLDQYGRALAAALPSPGTAFQVWDRSGTVLVRQPDDGTARAGARHPDAAVTRMVVNHRHTGPREFSAGDSPRIWSVASLPNIVGTGLRVSLDVPTAELYTRANRQLLGALGWVSAFALAIFLGAIVFAEFAVRRQAARLMRAVARIDAGDFAARIGAPYPRGELGEVMAAVDRTAASLEASRREIARTQEELVKQASHDALTGLANRNLLADRLAQTLIHAGRTQRRAAVLLLDLDRFKTVNDSLGHNHGDTLLREVAVRLAGCVRRGDTVARLGGDEFVVVLADLAHAADAVPVAEKVLAALAAPLSLEGRELTIGASIGICTCPADGMDAETLLRNADIAMYRAKEQGGRGYAFYTAEMNARILERLEIEAGLRRAVDRGELLLHYQPIVDTRTRRITGAEALVRWRHPQKGLVPPDRFIPVAEESGLIVAIGDWVLRTACEQAAAWRRESLPSLRIAVNLSARQFAERNLAASVGEALRRAGCDASALELEITESTLMRDPDAALLAMHRINDLGVRLAIDDFGTGYSSLGYLKRFPVRKLKIDRSFVRDIRADADDAAIVSAIAALARKLGLGVVAEGVETEEQLRFLEEVACSECQGYLFSKPRPAAEFADLLRAECNGARRPLQIVG